MNRKIISINKETYGKLLEYKNEYARKKIAEGKYDEANPSFSDIIIILLTKNKEE